MDKSGPAELYKFQSNNRSSSITSVKMNVLFTYVISTILYAPILVIFIVFSMSFIFQNVKGFIYLLFVLLVVLSRENLLILLGNLPRDQTRSTRNNHHMYCDIADFGRGTDGFSSFIIPFTMVYLCVPMFVNEDANWILIWLLLFEFIIELTFRSMYNCYSNAITFAQNIFLNIISGIGAGALVVGLFYVSKNERYLFFNEISSNKVVCSVPKKQKFKCTVFKNGEAVSSTTT